MEKQNELDTPIGNKDLLKLEPKDIEIKEVRVDKKEKDGKEIGKLVVFVCKHPDRSELIEISQIKYLKNDKARVVGLWYNLDKEEKIQKGSVLADFMIFFNVAKLIELTGKKLPTTRQSEDSNYLCIKAY